MGARKTASKHRFGRAFRLSRHQQYATHDVHQGNWRGCRTIHQLFTELLLLRATLQLDHGNEEETAYLADGPDSATTQAFSDAFVATQELFHSLEHGSS